MSEDWETFEERVQREVRRLALERIVDDYLADLAERTDGELEKLSGAACERVQRRAAEAQPEPWRADPALVNQVEGDPAAIQRLVDAAVAAGVAPAGTRVGRVARGPEPACEESGPRRFQVAVDVEAWRVAVADLAQVARWCGGDARSAAAEDRASAGYVAVPVANGRGASARAYPGDWVVHGVTSEFFVVKDDAFRRTYYRGRDEVRG